ncbi:MAG: M14 family metallopeptidase [Paenibacillus macerans]|uniref:Gamma-D-glutamyl-L-diamino acid endopeptidase 1 n=1 Tax=Paenibacillus macerans TaxID=44252 RepID=A0A090ZH68_PAEMA|nr:M14 family metallopeptidase [Paenibacillus macerans]KFN10664.1 gamma-D-glutamyl-L-diamino acid endopeptidase 1 [Paenibacillus macerans]MCY7561712.1 M14 family metallopeptidase [Paenibacillus macerans]MDU7475693.1 M14 family metallopeptidase [Paenibacillus macerans]MEC0154687.1 M14 family metallopeptidase [Paenibacillus macerans]MEC0328315.1 M14 family metallopeptidase [Paenibacillus macerans]
MRIQVRAGDTLWYYSQLFNLPLQLIVDSNAGVDAANLAVGQEVNIPGFLVSEYQIKPGDSLWKLARDRGISLDILILLNPSVNPNRLEIGQRVQLPLRVTWFVVDVRKPYDYAALRSDLNRLMDLYPFLGYRNIGNSVMGKPLPELRVGQGNKRVHANGAFHANEWITTPVLIKFLNHYSLALTNNTGIRGLQMWPYYEAATLSVVPMVNPDGVDLVINGLPEQEPYRSNVLSYNNGSADFQGWKANIRGVDLNDQFPALWEREVARNPQERGPRDYGGTAPLTEPEAIAMANLTRASDFARVMAFHTQGEVIYWGFENLEPPYAETIVNEFARVSGYEPVRYVESYAGYKDWFIQDWRRPGFTVELGSGVNPLPLAQFDEIYEESLGILLASLYM